MISRIVVSAAVAWMVVAETVAQQPKGFDLAEAIASAEVGAEIRIPAGTYAGPLTIDKPITLVGEGEVILDGGGGGDVLTIKAPDVTIQGLTLRNTGKSLDKENAGITGTFPRARILDCRFEDVLFGIYLKEAPDSVIRGNFISSKDLPIARRGDGIRLWQSSRVLIEENEVTGSRDVVIWFSSDVRLRRNHVTHGRYGFHFMYSDRSILEENRLEYNSVGAFLMYSHDLTMQRNILAHNRGPSGYGLGLKDMDGLIAEDNLSIGNRIGIHLDNSPSSVDVVHVYRRNVIAYNDIGIAFAPSVTRNHFTENTMLDNVEQIAVLGTGGGMFQGNLFTVDGVGNYWSDYRGYDLDEDGFGDIAYKAEGLFESLMDREPKLRMFLFSPSQHAIEMAARAFPIVTPRPKATDTAPLMEPVRAEMTLPVRSGGGSMLWYAALGLLAVGVACVAGGVRPWATLANGMETSGGVETSGGGT